MIVLNKEKMTRHNRVFLLSVLVFSFLILVRCTPKDKGPNILILMADDWNWPHALQVDDPNIKTPTFDRIVREGVLFRNAFVASPSCTPSRASMLTGMHPWALETGVHLWGALPSKFQVYTDILEEAGYYIGYRGKGWGPGRLEETGRTHNPAGKIKVETFEEFYEKRPKGKPFCFWYNSSDPHRSYEWQSGIKSGMNLEDVKVPPFLPDTEDTRTDICDYYYEVERFDSDAGRILQYLEERGDLDNTIVIMTGDNGMPFPRAKITLYDLGTKVPLAIRWPDKVAAGREVDDIVSLPDLAPTFIEVAGQEPPSSMTARSLMEILLSDKSGQIDPSRDRVFTSMELHCGRYPIRALRTHYFLYVQNFEPERPINLCRAYWESEAGYAPTWISIKALPQDSPMYQRIDGIRSVEELYDVKKDPYQLHNLAQDPDYTAVKDNMAADLEEELRRTKDPRILGTFEEIFYTPHYENQKKQTQKK
jgi:N-sulfoglucosamine sulfohydrolase